MKKLRFEGVAKCFDSEEEAFKAVKSKNYKEGDVIIIRYEGPKGGPGMREMLSTTAAIYGQGMGEKVALITDGRFSGGSHGILICHLPDAFKKDSITSIIRNDDEIELDLEKNSIRLNLSDNIISDRFDYTILKPKLELRGYLKKFNKLVGTIENGYSTY